MGAPYPVWQRFFIDLGDWSEIVWWLCVAGAALILLTFVTGFYCCCCGCCRKVCCKRKQIQPFNEDDESTLKNLDNDTKNVADS